MSLIGLIFVGSAFAKASELKPVVLFVYNSNPQYDYIKGDRDRASWEFEDLKSLLRLRTQVRAIDVPVEQFSEIKEGALLKLKPGEQIVGIVIEGHGNKAAFSFSNLKIHFPDSLAQ